MFWFSAMSMINSVEKLLDTFIIGDDIHGGKDRDEMDGEDGDDSVHVCTKRFDVHVDCFELKAG